MKTLQNQTAAYRTVKGREEKKRLKIMYIVLSLNVGGAEKLVNDIILDLDPGKYLPVVCCLDEIGPLGEGLREKGFKVLYFRKRRPGLDLGLIRWLRDTAKKEGADIMHAHQYTPYFFAVLAALLSRVKVIYTEHGRLYPDRRNYKRYLIDPLLAVFTDHIVSIVDSNKRAMVHYDNFPAGSIKVIHNGVKTGQDAKRTDVPALKRSLGIDAGSAVVGTAARLNSIKNIPMLLRAFRRVLDEIPDSVLLVAGEGAMESELKETARSLGIYDRVKFLGLRTDLADIYRTFDVFTLSSYTEGISITLLEAMASSIPAVVTDVGGNPEVVLDGSTGFLVKSDDDAAMAERIVELLRDPDKRRLFGGNASMRVREHFSFDRMLGGYLALYDSCVPGLHMNGTEKICAG